MSDDLPINAKATIPGRELNVSSTRASGPGGQHVNKSNTKIVLEWDIETSEVLTATTRARLKKHLGGRINSEGIMKVTSESSRSQKANIEAAREKLASLVRGALQVKKRRVKTKPSRAAKRRRINDKRKRSDKKKTRKKPSRHDD